MTWSIVLLAVGSVIYITHSTFHIEQTTRMRGNRLANATSPYLRSAAQQPVDWHEWGEEAFQLAKGQDKPILLDSGAVWCHWCHVIDRESYENPEIAKLINELYVPIKIDRDARPDIDRRYQEVISVISGQGGWPLTAFLTPDGHVIYGGTYFPPEDRHGMPGMKTVLTQVAETYRTKKADVLAQSKQLHEDLQRHAEQQLQPQALSRAVVNEVLERMRAEADLTHGGFGSAPKFPHAQTMELALWALAARRDETMRPIIKAMLDGMAKGGMRDQLGGAFHRYSTDALWRVPHFEVLLDVNAGLLHNYIHAYQALGDPFYQEVAVQLMGYWNRFLSDQASGGFYASQDADVSLEDDGDYWTWTVEEVAAVLTSEEAQLIRRYYDVGEAGEMRENPQKNVLFIAQGPETMAKLTGLPVARVRQLLEQAQVKLFEARLQRKAPYIDQTLYVDWNGWIIRAYLDAYRAFGDAQAKAFALRTLERLWQTGFDPERGMCHSIVDGKPVAPGLLDDQAEMILALVDAFQLTQKSTYLEHAGQLMDLTLRRFGDAVRGGFFDVPEGHETLGTLTVRKKPFQDYAAPPGNGLAAIALDQLAALTGKASYREAAGQTLELFAGMVANYGTFASTLALALDLHLTGPTHVVIAGRTDDPKSEELLEAAHRAFRLNKMIQHLDPASPPHAIPEALRPILEGADLATAKAFVCAGTQCAAPTADPTELRQLLSSFGL